MSIQDRLREKGIVLPSFNPPAGNYCPVVKMGPLLYTAGQTPKKDGVLVYAGKLGDNVSDVAGYDAVRLCTLNILTLLDHYAQGLDKIDRIVKMTVFLNCTSEYADHAKAANGATDLLVELFGEAGCPARSTVGVNALPGGAVCEVEMVVALKTE
jgi:enamine deaminase RidA (YjgF/YER057c/UK114 family)